MTLTALLQSHQNTYPLMQEQDFLKLLYQRSFGCGHMVSDETAAMNYMKEEWQDCVPASPKNNFEALGNGFARFYLEGAINRGISAEALTRLFIMSAGLPLSGNAEQTFLSDCKVLEQLCENQQLPCSVSAVTSLKDTCIQDNFRPFRHSEIYRSAYQPHYRVISECLLPLLPLLELPELLSSLSNEPLLTLSDLYLPDSSDCRSSCYVIAIDGRCASGKTTLAKLLSEVLRAPIISMDDFFLPPELRTKQRLLEPGGNIHYERFTKEVAEHIKSTDAFTYERYDCHTMAHSTIVVPSARIRIVEGSYSLRPEWHSLYETALFTTCSPDLQKERILQRNGEGMWKRFEEAWIPLEEHYFEVNSEFLTSCVIIRN